MARIGSTGASTRSTGIIESSLEEKSGHKEWYRRVYSTSSACFVGCRGVSSWRWRSPKGYCPQIVSIIDGRSHPVVTNIRAQACGCKPTGFSGHHSTFPAFRSLNLGMGLSYLANRPMLQFGVWILAACKRPGLLVPSAFGQQEPFRTSFTRLSLI